ncbi:DUF2884 family protein [Microbulbifer thermotolerans]|uniref:DUF2884 family protein n=1 Tax=Microbulbifer thermotolerans TaxID=252514 RepID=A0A143HPI8_MICTH|nr:DUF2884 family protein [Microbulbifer thermotolerans]AMX03629.1 hypothetical protein A3224_14485 [Microbulbifer thermotolerans]
MWKPLALSAAILLPGTAMAGGIHLSTGEGDNCNADLNRTVRVGPDFLEIREDSENADIPVRFQTPTQLVIEGQAIQLDDRQQQLMREYHSQLHGSGREILLISLEAVDLALNGISVALTALAGPDHPNNAELQQASDDLLRRVEARLNEEGEIYTLGDPDIDALIEQTVEEELEPKIAALAADSAGTIAWQALKAVFTGGRSIEQQAEAAAEEAGEKVEQRGKQLELRAKRLCGQLQTIDQLENTLHSAIPELAPYDIINIEL